MSAHYSAQPLITRCSVLAFGLGLMVLAGCGGSEPSSTAPAGSGAPAATPTASRPLTLVSSEDVTTLDPALGFDTWSTAVIHATTRRLTDYDHEGRLIAEAASGWEIEDGGRTYRLKLREGLKFEDGSAVTASHFVAALKRVQDPATASPGADFYKGIAKVEAPDPATLLIRLSAPDPTLPNVLGMTFAAPYKAGPNGALASGPYRIEKYQAGTEVVLAKNEQYSGPETAAPKLVLQLKITDQLQMTRYRSGEADVLPAVPPGEYESVMNDDEQKQRVVQGVVNQTWYFGMNVTRKPWSDPRVRRAALLAIDREGHQQLAGAGEVANSILPPKVPGFSAERRLPSRDPEGARKLLTEAGYPNGIPESEKVVLWLSNSSSYQRQAELLESSLKEVGIPVELRPVTFSEYKRRYRDNADCWLGGWYPDFPDAGNFLEPVLHGRNRGPGRSNASRYANPEVDRLLDQAHAAPLGPSREALYRKVEDKLLEDLPWVPLYFEVETRLPRAGVKGVRVHPVWRQILTGITRD